MSSLNNTHTDSVTALAAKAGPPVSISLATIAGYNVSDLILWLTLVYTVLMIAHKLYQIWKDITGRGGHARKSD
jgi:hypothetical protein